MRQQSTSCIETRPTTQTVYLDGIAINIAAVSRKTGYDQGFLSRVFSGKRIPNMVFAQNIADAIGFSLDRFVDAVKAKRIALLPDQAPLVPSTSTRQRAS